MFEDDVYVDLSGVLDGRPNYANITFLELFVGPYIDLSEVMDKGPDYVNALFLELCAGARCPPVLTLSRGAAIKVYGWEKESLQARHFRFFFFFHFFLFVYG